MCGLFNLCAYDHNGREAFVCCMGMQRLVRAEIGLLHAARGLNIVGGDVLCLLPTKDSPNNITAMTATSILFEMVSMMAENVAARA